MAPDSEGHRLLACRAPSKHSSRFKKHTLRSLTQKGVRSTTQCIRKHSKNEQEHSDPNWSPNWSLAIAAAGVQLVPLCIVHVARGFDLKTSRSVSSLASMDLVCELHERALELIHFRTSTFQALDLIQ